MVINVVQCSNCKDVMFLRCPYDSVKCSCHNVRIFSIKPDYITIDGDNYITSYVNSDITFEELYSDFVKKTNNFGLISNVENINEVVIK